MRSTRSSGKAVRGFRPPLPLVLIYLERAQLRLLNVAKSSSSSSRDEVSFLTKPPPSHRIPFLLSAKVILRRGNPCARSQCGSGPEALPQPSVVFDSIGIWDTTSRRSPERRHVARRPLSRIILLTSLFARRSSESCRLSGCTAILYPEFKCTPVCFNSPPKRTVEVHPIPKRKGSMLLLDRRLVWDM